MNKYIEEITSNEVVNVILKNPNAPTDPTDPTDPIY